MDNQTVSREGIERVLGPVDDALAAQIAGTGASERELQEARGWFMDDESLVNEFRPFPKGRVAELLEILESSEISSEEA